GAHGDPQRRARRAARGVAPAHARAPVPRLAGREPRDRRRRRALRARGRAAPPRAVPRRTLPDLAPAAPPRPPAAALPSRPGGCIARPRRSQTLAWRREIDSVLAPAAEDRRRLL